MKENKPSQEKGQALVLIVLAMVALLAFLSLAIDGGQIYSQRRTAQNAADASALSGAADVAQRVKKINNLKWKCNQLEADNSNWQSAINKAVAQANTNAFTIESTMANNNGVEVNCVDTGGNEYIDVHVRITQPVTTSFLQFVNSGKPVNTVDAVVRIKPPIVFADGASIVATKNTCDSVQPSSGGITFSGSYNITINGGGIRSNDCCTVNGYDGRVTINPSADGWTCDGNITLNPNWTDPSDPHLNPPPVNGGDVNVDSSKMETALRKACDAITTTKPKIQNSGTYGPGKYQGINITNNGDNVTLSPGLYCITGSFTVSGGKVTGHDVTIFMDYTAGIFSTNGNGTVTLTAYPKGCEYDTPGCSPAIGGLLLLYLPKGDIDALTGRPKQVTLGGTSGSDYLGTIFAPYTKIDVGGTSDTLSNVRAQFVGQTVEIHGDATMSINYDPNYSLEIPSYMNLQK